MDMLTPAGAQLFDTTAAVVTTAAPIGAAGAGAVARLLEYTRGHFLALPPHTTLEVVEKPRVVPVPGAPYYAYGLMEWQGQWLPLLHLDTVLRAYANMPLPPVPRYCLVVAYQSAPGQPVEHGALALPELPQFVTVTDDDACALPDDSDLWALLAISCFSWNGRPVPILDTGRLFSAYHG